MKHRSKKTRNRNLKILKAITKGDMATAIELHVGKNRSGLKCLFMADDEHSDRYKLLSGDSSISDAQKGMLYTRSEAKDFAANYSGCIFISKASKRIEEIPKEKLQKMLSDLPPFSEKILAGPDREIVTITDTHNERKKDEPAKIKVSITEVGDMDARIENALTPTTIKISDPNDNESYLGGVTKIRVNLKR